MGYALKHTFVHFDDYLVGKRDVETRSEYLDGEIYAMAGVSETHNTIASDFCAQINTHLPDHCLLSPNTKRVDLKEQFDNYTQIPSLLEYVVVSQDTPSLRLFRRRTAWQAEFYYAEDTITLESGGLEIPITHIYRRVRREVGLETPFSTKTC